MNYFYYPKTIWGVTNAFINLWNDIEVRRYDDTGTVVKVISAVPVRYGYATKAQLDRRKEEMGLDYWYQQIPRIGVLMTGMIYDSNRARSANEDRFWLDNALDLNNSLTLKKDFQPTPYNFTFQTTILTNSMEDMSIILENVLPYFNPALSLEVNEFSFLTVKRNLITTLDSVSLNFTDEIGEEERRILKTNVDCTVHGWMYKPVSNDSIIKTINTQYFINPNSNYVNAYSTVGYKGTSAIPSTSAFDTSGVSVLSTTLSGENTIFYTHTNTASANA